MNLSVVLTSYNHSRFLSRAIQAILEQSLSPDEFIIIDDASTDNSVEIIREYARSNGTIRPVQNETNRGVISALNQGLYLARGDYVIYATADDLVLPGLFEESMGLLRHYPEAGLCSALATVINEEGVPLHRLPSPIVARQGFVSPRHALQLLHRYATWLVGNTAVFRRDALLEAGGFSPDLGPLCDTVVSQVIALRHGFCFIPRPLAAVRLSESSYSSRVIRDARRSLEVMRRAADVIHRVSGELFPEDPVPQVEKDWLYTYGVTLWREEVFYRQRLFVEKTLPLFKSQSSWLSRLFLSGFKLATYVQEFLVRVYFFIMFARWRAFIKRGLTPRVPVQRK
ncbi:MAG TPA: glycosyltransferase [bacterium]|mgnify:CR=1 FL=1|nr:glycosyltransferase [bacterium]